MVILGIKRKVDYNMTVEKLLSMTKKERLATYKNNEKQTIYTGLMGENGLLQRQRAVVFGNVAVNNCGWVYELTNETGAHKQKFTINSYPKWNSVSR